MLTITKQEICEWCEMASALQTVKVVGFEEYTHNVCVDCLQATDCLIVEFCEDCGWYEHEGVDCEYALCDTCGESADCFC